MGIGVKCVCVGNVALVSEACGFVIRIVNQHFREIDDEEKRDVDHLPEVDEGTWPEFGDDRHLAHMSGMLSRLNNLSKS